MDEDDKKDDEIAIPDAALDDVLGEEIEEEDPIVDPLAAIDEFGADTDSHEKQWE
jgi:hypothetical protein